MRLRKEPWSRPLADLVGPIIDPVLAKRGFGQSDVILYWDEIVGERFAALSQPAGGRPPSDWPGPLRCDLQMAFAASAAAASISARRPSSFTALAMLAPPDNTARKAQARLRSGGSPKPAASVSTSLSSSAS